MVNRNTHRRHVVNRTAHWRHMVNRVASARHMHMVNRVITNAVTRTTINETS